MGNTLHILVQVFLLLGPAFGAMEPSSSASVVRVQKSDAGYQLVRNGQDYFIRGAGGRHSPDTLSTAGGNSIRTWHVNENLGAFLDRAQKLGLTVTVGLWLEHERHGFRYSDPARVARQKDDIRRAVQKYKDHPAVLMWGLGNEMEGDGRNPKIWEAVNDIARMVKMIDPNHPTMTVIAGVWKNKLRQIQKHCPDIDVVGINCYGNLKPLVEEIERQGLKRPYVLTEFGPTGWWQVEKTAWGAELEPTSTEKAATYRAAYQTAVAGKPGFCLGCYAFLWGHKQEHTRTWFGMFLPSGERTAAVDVMTEAWTGRLPENTCPTIESLRVMGHCAQARPGAPSHVYESGTLLRCHVEAGDKEDDALRIVWELRSESTDRRSGGDPEVAPPAHPDAIVKTGDLSAWIETPKKPGAYRVFVYVLDDHGNAATANIPIRVTPDAEEPNPQVE